MMSCSITIAQNKQKSNKEQAGKWEFGKIRTKFLRAIADARLRTAFSDLLFLRAEPDRREAGKALLLLFLQEKKQKSIFFNMLS
jgi:hypothetical protein